jgi:hypothetical protein
MDKNKEVLSRSGEPRSASGRSPFNLCSNLFLYLFILGFFTSQLTYYLENWKQSSSPKPTPQVRTFHEESLTSDLIDFASSKSGGKIISDLSSPFLPKYPQSSILSDDNSASSCWCFKGSEGSVSIELSSKIAPSSFEIFHLNSLDYSSAPKTFKIFGGLSQSSQSLLLSGQLDLEIQEESRATLFKFSYTGGEVVKLVTLNITSNHGNQTTCVYQFKVHGLPQN